MASLTPVFGRFFYLSLACICLSVINLWPIHAISTPLLAESPVNFIHMEADGGTVLPFDSSATNKSPSGLFRPKQGSAAFQINTPKSTILVGRDTNILPQTGLYPSNRKVDQIQEINLAVGFDDLFLSLIKSAYDKSASLLLTPRIDLDRQTLIREEIARTSPNQADIKSASAFGDKDMQFWLKNNRWANFQNLAAVNMTPSTLYWLEGDRWASFHSPPPLSTTDLTAKIRPENFQDPNINKPSKSTRIKNSPTTNNANRRPTNKYTPPDPDKGFAKFIYRFLIDAFQEPIFFIVSGVILLAFALGKIIRLNRH
jgi:hypothetical protein